MRSSAKRFSRIMAATLAAGMALTCTACGSGSASSAAASGSASAASGSTAASSSAAAASGETYDLSWAGIGSADAIDTWIGNEIASRVAEKTNNKVTITVYPASQLGDLTQAYDEIIDGTIDMGLFTVYGTHDPVAEVPFTPFLTSNLDEFKKVYTKDGFMFKTLNDMQNSRGVTLLGVWPSGYLGLAFTKLSDDATTLFDFTKPKNELIRVPSMDSMMLSAKSMGFNVTTMNYSDVYTALQTGVVDGSWHGGAYSNYESFRDVIKYYVDYRVCNDTYSCIINSKKLQSMPQEYQDAITSIATDVLNEGIQKIGDQEAQSLKDLETYGIKVITPTDEQRETMKNYFIDKVWPQMDKFYGDGFMEKLKTAIAG